MVPLEVPGAILTVVLVPSRVGTSMVPGVRLRHDFDQQVAGRRTVCPGTPLARQTDGLAVVDTGGDSDGQLALADSAWLKDNRLFAAERSLCKAQLQGRLDVGAPRVKRIAAHIAAAARSG
jgi:hypothetical protein